MPGTVYLEESELAKQLHPKENDLVFLVPERLNREKKDMDRNGMQDRNGYYCGYVHKFRRTSVMRSGKAECSLCIQTQDNLPASLNELTKCIVISSLVTTQRKLKAMSLLNSRNQLARAVLNPNPMDFCTKDLLTTTSERIIAYLKDFNEDQKKAIETAYAMVKHSPSVAKICLIHGPPGTGKSKTIVGLLYRLLTENQRKGRSDENFNAKIKQNRVLVCAPSNAAVDELMKKIILEFKEKCKDKKNPLGNCGDINLVRLGPEKSINTEVLKFSLDSQVNHRMKKDLPSHIQEMDRRKDFLDGQLDELSRQRALCRGGREMQRKELDGYIAKVAKERQELASKIKEVQGRPQKTQNTIILESHVICCTLSTSGGFLLESAFRGQGGVPFSCVIVDEAGQSCEVETLSPLIHRCNKLILVGDPKQLPPTVISMKAQEYGYDQSMMARFCKLLEENVEQNMIGRLPVLQLTIQYRMHPDICLFPSNYVYNKNLKTNRLTEAVRCSSEWPFQPYLVFDVGDGSERRDNDSYINVQEIKLVMEIIKLIKDKRKDISFRNIGIITHYKAQKTMIQKDLEKEFDKKGLLQPIMMGESRQQDPEASSQKKKSSECMHASDEPDFSTFTQSGISCVENGVTHTGPAEVDTVDAFQGRQKDCIIVTCVRASAVQGSIGFLASLQRLNVTITRAKYSLFILGHLRTLMENQHWNELIQDAQKRGAIIKTSDPNYRHDAMKILKLKPVLQRSLTHPPATAPEAPRPQGGLPSNKLDSGLARTSFAASLYHTPSDAVPSKEPERLSLQDRLRDPRLHRRLDAEAKGTFLKDAQPASPQLPGVVHLLGEPGFPVLFPDLGFVVPPSTAIVAPLSSHRSPLQAEPPPAHPAAPSTSQRKYSDPDSGFSHRREPGAFGEEERRVSVTHHMLRSTNWDKRGLEQEDSSAKKRRFL
ncbi:putative helicase senataxin isoform X3 [Peromyscus maniculatus bairdii]|uniref:putative helicase senataxin isoform X3 n=1 Tax=Peromyscus maniculatus bairdii TaxID=230844 RepID=UPI003FD45A55